MKKSLLLTFAFIAICVHAFGQSEYKVADNGGIVVEEIIENTGLSVSQAHDILSVYFANTLNNSSNTQRIDSPDHLTYKGIFTHEFNMGMLIYNVDVAIDIAIKENRIRIKCTADRVSGRSVRYNNMDKEYRLCENAPVIDKHRPTYTGLYRSQAETIFNEAVTGMHNIIANAKDALVKGATDNDW